MPIDFTAIDFETATCAPDSACAVGLVRVEAGRITRRMTRLIRPPSRAFEFTYLHGIAWRDVADGFEFTISDNGPGIAPEYHDRIWGIFQTLAARDKVEGTGIGLSVVQKIVESRGGKVSLDESAPGEGATFRFVWAKALRQGFH